MSDYNCDIAESARLSGSMSRYFRNVPLSSIHSQPSILLDSMLGKSFSIFVLIAMLSGFLKTHCQDIKVFTSGNAVTIRSIDPLDTSFNDLESIGLAIGNSRVVMLGEQDHGDAFTFSAKTRLVKYLHQTLGFNVLAFESDFFSLNEGWGNLQKDSSSIKSFLRNNVLHLWSYCDCCSNLLYDYIPSTFQTTWPLQVTGFDNQLFLAHSLSNLPCALDSFIKASSLAIGKDPEYEEKIKPLFDSLILTRWLAAYQQQTLPDSLIVQTDSYLNLVRIQSLEKYVPEAFWIKVIENLVSSNKMYALFKKKYNAVGEIRDLQMAMNLQWLLNTKYPNEKLIVWAANEHVRKSNDKYASMGYALANELLKPDDVFVIGFTSSTGESGRLGRSTYKIAAPPASSIENWLKQYKYSFLNYKRYNTMFPNSREFFNQRGSTYIFGKRQWNKIYDGILFIREMEACKNLFVTSNP